MLLLNSSSSSIDNWASIHLSWGVAFRHPLLRLTYFDGYASTRTEVHGVFPDRPLWLQAVALTGITSLNPFNMPLAGMDRASVGDAIEKFVRYAAERYASETSESPDPCVLPLFVSSDRRLGLGAFTEFVNGIVVSLYGLPCELEIVCRTASPPDRQKRSALNFPITVVCEEPVYAELSNGAWYLADQDVRERMLRIEPWPSSSGAPSADIVVASDRPDNTGSSLLTAGLERATARTRLVIVLDPTPSTPFAPPRAARADIAIAVIPLSAQVTAAQGLMNFLNEIVHDNPLHQAMHEAKKAWEPPLPPANGQEGSGDWWRTPRIYADPASNNALRISTALPGVSRAATEVFAVSRAADIDRFAHALAGTTNDPAVAELTTALRNIDDVAEPFRKALDKPLDFSRESRGLVPMSKIAASADALRGTIREVSASLAALLSNDALAQAVEQEQARKVDAQLFFRGPRGTGSPVAPQWPLQPRSKLRLRVHIGQRARESLIVGETPALDPLLPPLPDEEPHKIDIIVFPKDFLLESASVQPVEVPRFGGTRPVEWDLVAPDISYGPLPLEKAGGPLDSTRGVGAIHGDQATLRFNVYYKNQLLQSFLLTAKIGTAGQAAAEPCITIVCDFSQTRRFGQLDRLDDRLVSLALNADGNDGTHTLMIRGEGKPISLQWSETQLGGYTEGLRTALFATFADQNGSTFTFDQSLRLIKNSQPSSDDTIRSLAKAGAAVYEQLKGGNNSLRSLLDSIQSVSQKTLQIVLTDVRYVMPWALLYDYDVPRSEVAKALPVCRGTSADGKPCNCQATGDRYCLRGFWGLRHVLELLTKGPTPLDSNEPGRIALGPTDPAVGVVSTVTDSFVRTWVDDLKGAPGTPVAEYGDPEELLPLLRNSATRPALVVIVCHHRNAGTNKIPIPELLRSNKELLLGLGDVSKELRGKHNWDAPRAVVLLMACASGIARVDTGIDLPAALMELGAGGVVGTECTVYTPMVARIGRDIVRHLRNKESMGTAMREAVWSLAQEGCLAGLAFKYIGRSEVKLP